MGERSIPKVHVESQACEIKIYEYYIKVQIKRLSTLIETAMHLTTPLTVQITKLPLAIYERFLNNH